jgi:hypothetical protein
MDQKLLNALNNLSDSLSEIADALSDSSSAQSDVAKSLSSGDFVSTIKEIKIGLEDLKKTSIELSSKQDTIIALCKENNENVSKRFESNEKMMKNQQQSITALGKQRSGDKKSEFEKAGGDKKQESMIKKGVTMILLIAVAVLAIGMAFKLVGKIDFLSVIGLGISMFVIAQAFAKIGALKLTLKEAAIAAASMVMMSIAVTVSSWILSLIVPISMNKLLTGIAITAMFLVMGPSMVKLIEVLSPAAKGVGKMKGADVGGVSWGDLAKVTVLLIAISVAVTVSSWILQFISPIGIAQLFTGIAIVTMFAIMSPHIQSLIKSISPVAKYAGGSIGGTSWGDILKVVIILIAMSFAITVSSWVLQYISPIGIAQLLTGIAITAMFHVAGPSFAKMVRNISIFRVSWMDILKATVLLIGLSMAVTVSSWILKYISPIGIAQLLTGIAITAMFYIAGPVFAKIVAIVSLLNVTWMDIIKTTAILIGLSIAVTVSSWILSFISPMGLMQMITGVVIVAMFWVMSKFLPDVAIGLALVDKILGKGKLWLIPVVFIAISAAIMVSSLLLSVSAELSWKQMLGTLLIGLIFAGLSYVMPEMAAGLVMMDKMLGKGKMWLIPVVYLAISVAIMLSSHVLSMMADLSIMTMLKILAFSVVMTASVILLGVAALVLAKIGLTNIIKGSASMVILATSILVTSLLLNNGSYNKFPSTEWVLHTALAIGVFGGLSFLLMKIGGLTTYIKGSLAIVLLATTMMVSSHIIAMGDYGNYPSAKWATGVGASLLGFGLAAIGLGLAMMFDGGLTLLLGSVAVLGVALTLVGVSHIIAKGNYSKYPSMSWIGGVGLSMTGFTLAMITLGGLIVGSFGLGAVALAAGSAAVLSVARTMVKTSFILQRGKWTGGPSKEWSEGVSIALGAFMPVYDMLLDSNAIWGSITGSKGVTPQKFGKAIEAITKSIVLAAIILGSFPGVWKGGPSKEWSEGVGTAIGAFAPVYDMMTASKSIMSSITGSKGITPEKFSDAIKTVSMGIISAGFIFAISPGIWKNGPTKAWGEGVGKSISAFLPIYDMMTSSNSLWSSISGGKAGSVTNFVKAIKMISHGIVAAGYVFKKSPDLWKSGPTKEWATGVGSSISAFTPVFKIVSEEDFWGKLKGAIQGIKSISKTIVSVGFIFAKYKGGWASYPSVKWAEGVSASILSFTNLMTVIGNTPFKKSTSYLAVTAAKRIVDIARVFQKDSELLNKSINPDFMKGVEPNIMYYIKLANALNKETGIDKKIKNMSAGNLIGNVANGLLSLAVAYDRLAKSITKFGTSLKGLDQNKINSFRTLTANLAVLSALNSKMFDNMLTVLESRSSVFSKLLQAQVSGNKPSKGVSSGPVFKGAGPKNKDGKVEPFKSKYGNDRNEQMDSLIDRMGYLISLFDDRSQFDEFITKKMKETKKSSVGKSDEESV